MMLSVISYFLFLGVMAGIAVTLFYGLKSLKLI
ncbi:cytochrome b6-f complex subunit PetL [Lyngbya confervoides]|uniref:Cytochrome b6-f complex subunit 6 n=1 Tax=Lyngbya confervoides BDU141951 TaxID=1574623 RepID=A0ABD4T4B6_9CYAN|nr:cytochrome b6-f complex subunit PetL [Lyngbya confervoides]MCM1983567.1 cytochrome B6-F complex subunit VI (PetL) [Lyngbya confervoides BDU141951]